MDINNDYELKKLYTEKKISNNYSIEYYFGHHKLDKEKNIFVENIKIENKNIMDYEINQITKEIVLLKKFKNKPYFPKLINILKTDNNSENNILLIFEGNNISLDLFIKSEVFDYRKQKMLIKYIIYQIAYGLYILHSNNIIHHNLKPCNILINEESTISIYNFFSSIFKGEKSIYFTMRYAAPEYLYNNSITIDEKYDMWALGVIIFELYLKRNNMFEIKDKKKENVNNMSNQLNEILSYFDIDEKNKKEDVNTLLKNIFDGKINPKFKIDNFSNEINDPEAIELINNLLVINPTKRFSAEQVLKSNYLKHNIGLEPFEIEPTDFSLTYKEKKNLNITIDELINSIKIFNNNLIK